jgi:uncharacterized protein
VAGRPRAVLDTNVFVSGLINPRGSPAAVLKALRARRFLLISSPPNNDEIIEVLNRPYLRDRYGLGDRIFDVAYILWELAELVMDPPNVRAADDPDDDKFLAAAVGGRADYLVTGDVGHLLGLRNYRGVAIISPRDFASLF